MEPEYDELTRVLDKFQEKSPRDVLLLRTALRTGARAKELLGIRKSDLNAFDETVFIKGLKGSNDREIPLPRELFSKLMALAQAQPGERVFEISYSRLQAIWRMYRPTTKKFHSLRHTFAIRLFKKTKDVRLVQVALGHRNITNTMVYADYVYSQQELRKLIL